MDLGQDFAVPRILSRSPRISYLGLMSCLGLGLVMSACAPSEAPSPSPGASVLLISADSLRVDRLPAWGALPGDPSPSPTPHLDALIARGTVYLDAWSASPWTAPSMVSVMTGLDPPSHGVVYRDDTTPANLPTLPRLLAARGDRIGNFSFFSEISYFRNLGLGPAAAGLGHGSVPESFRGWLGEAGEEERFFAWVHLLETHLPYGATGYRAVEAAMDGSDGLVKAQLQGTVPVGTTHFEEGDRARLIELYDRDIRAMDAALGEILAALEEAGRLESTLIVFVADHGEELLDYGWVGHASTSIDAKLVPEILRVPLILAGPSVPAGEVRRELVRQVDILPTVLGLLGLDIPKPLDGRRLPGLGGRSEHEVAFFDTSPGGNLTPQEQRGERLQGATDGRCLLTSRSAPDGPEVRGAMPVEGVACAARDVERLAQALEDWRVDQTTQRLELLDRHGGGAGPSFAEADGWAETLEIVSPTPGSVLDWRATGGQIAFEYRRAGDAEAGESAEVWIQYRLGTPPLAVRGGFAVEQRRVVFGPIPQGYWNDLATYSPFRLRVVDARGKARSGWVEYEVVEAR